MKMFIEGVERIGVKNFGALTAASTDAEFRDALAVQPSIAQFFTPEFLATLQPNASAAKPTGSPTKTSSKDS